jgi:hypothetical protein
MLQFLSDIYTVTVDMIYRPECILNRPYYIESQEMIGILNKYTYSFSYLKKSLVISIFDIFGLLLILIATPV